MTSTGHTQYIVLQAKDTTNTRICQEIIVELYNGTFIKGPLRELGRAFYLHQMQSQNLFRICFNIYGQIWQILVIYGAVSNLDNRI